MQTIRGSFPQLSALHQVLASSGDTYPFINYRVFIEFCKATRTIEDGTYRPNDEAGGGPLKRSAMSNYSHPNSEKSKAQGGKVTNTSTLKPWYAAFTEGQAAVCFANAIWERDRVVQDTDVHPSIIDKADRVARL